MEKALARSFSQKIRLGKRRKKSVRMNKGDVAMVMWYALLEKALARSFSQKIRLGKRRKKSVRMNKGDVAMVMWYVLLHTALTLLKENAYKM